MKIHEVTEPDGSLTAIELVNAGGLAVKRGAQVMPLPEGALIAVMNRYGAELDPAAKIDEVGSLDLGADGIVKHVRHLDLYEVIGRDWLVYDGKAALATTVAGALEHLATAGAVRGNPT